MATIDRYGVCLISDVNTNKYSFHRSVLMDNACGYGNFYFASNSSILVALWRLFRHAKYDFILLLIDLLDLKNRCKWSPNIGDPLLYIRYGERSLNILDIEKQKLIWVSSMMLGDISKISSSN